jgi:hypothetical protein
VDGWIAHRHCCRQELSLRRHLVRGEEPDARRKPAVATTPSERGEAAR